MAAVREGSAPTRPVLDDGRFSAPDFIESSLGRFQQSKVTAAITGVSVLLAALLRWTQDDAYISLRYARNFAEGRGLVYNVGEHVEGYTNFLWTALLSVPYRLGIDPVAFGHVVSLAAMAVTIVVTIRLATRCLGSHLLGNVAGLVLVANFTFLAYGTGGLETQLQTALVASVLLLVIGPIAGGTRLSDGALIGAGALSGMAVLTRMDSVVLLAPPLVLLIADEIRHRESPGEMARRLALLIVPGLVIVTPWMVWRYSTYGGVVPNTAAAKRQGPVSVLQGASFTILFLAVSGLFVLVPTLFVRGREVLRHRTFPLIAVCIAAWLVYLAAVGSDFMEFRFMVAALPLVSIAVTALLVTIRSRRWQLVVVAVLILALPVHALAFRGGANVDSASDLYAYVNDPDRGWVRIGELLGDALGGGAAAEEPDSGVPMIAVTAAGALPYEARLTAVDMLGLTDSWVAENGVKVPAATLLPKPGHARISPPSYLVDRGVPLVVGHPQVRTPLPEGESYGQDLVTEMFYGTPIPLEDFPDDASVVEMPLPDRPGHGPEVLAMIYLTPNAVVDGLIDSGEWRQVPLGG